MARKRKPVDPLETDFGPGVAARTRRKPRRARRARAGRSRGSRAAAKAASSGPRPG